MTLVTLSWPDKRLSPNGRYHWAQKAKATAAARREAYGAAWEAGLRGMDRADSYRLTFAYHPPDRKRRDAQNMPAMLKGSIDGIADALGVDDSVFMCAFPGKFDAVARPLGKIVVRVEPGRDGVTACISRGDGDG